VRPADAQLIAPMLALIHRSARQLSVGYYDAEQIDSTIRYVFGVDSVLVADGTYFAAWVGGQLAGCGGWSQRNSLYGGDQRPAGSMQLLRPGLDPARIRAFFVAPEMARKGVGRALYQHCEGQAASAGYTSLELAATLAGVAFYEALGFKSVETLTDRLPNGVLVCYVRMQRSIRPI
jgi:GNAT superfamily N-acetyltransferase